MLFPSNEERDPFEIIEDHTAKTHPFYGIGVQQHRNDTIRNVMQTTRVLAMTRKPSREHQITIGTSTIPEQICGTLPITLLGRHRVQESMAGIVEKFR